MGMLVTTVPADIAGVDPEAAPATVPDKQLFVVPRSLTNTDSAPQQISLSAEGAALTVELWALIEPDPEPQVSGQPVVLADRVFLQIGISTVAAVDAVVRVDDTVGAVTVPLIPPTGKVYARITAGSAAGRRLHIIFV